MRMLAIFALAATACAPQAGPAGHADTVAATDNASDAPPAPDPLRACDGSKANALLGRVIDGTTLAEAKRLVGAGTTRVIPPGAMVTMDYRGNRLNIDTDTHNKAVRFYCG